MSSAAPRDSTSFEVRDALGLPGCAVCRLALRSVGRWLAAVVNEGVNDVQLRDELRAARGFCNVHAHRWLTEVHSVLGTAIVYEDLLKASLRELDAADKAQRGGLWRAIMGAQAIDVGDCPACRAQTQAEERFLAALLATVAVDPGVLEGSAGICARHVRSTLRRGGPGAELILRQTRSAVERLLGELAEVIRKEDYRFRHEARTDAERSAPRRAVAHVAGAAGLVDTPLDR
ncbi:MAG: hypothetical protein M3069_05965 [Chloroflexota bacterium]|nr:hypothetical protein [Chloroflexota bacterium]